MTTDVLILNRNFCAIQFTSWERALTLLYLDRAMVVDEEYRTYGFQDWLQLSRTIRQNPAGFVSTPKLKIAIPEVIALRFFGEVPQHEVPFTRRNIYQHYGNKCCYCGRRFPPSELNLDHIVPRSRGGRTDWENIVTACIPCNLRKGDRLPWEVGMQMRIRPSKPHSQAALSLIVRSPFSVRRSWQRFIDSAYWDSRLEDS